MIVGQIAAHVETERQRSAYPGTLRERGIYRDYPRIYTQQEAYEFLRETLEDFGAMLLVSEIKKTSEFLALYWGKLTDWEQSELISSLRRLEASLMAAFNYHADGTRRTPDQIRIGY